MCCITYTDSVRGPQLLLPFLQNLDGLKTFKLENYNNVILQYIQVA